MSNGQQDTEMAQMASEGTGRVAVLLLQEQLADLSSSSPWGWRLLLCLKESVAHMTIGLPVALRYLFKKEQTGRCGSYQTWLGDSACHNSHSIDASNRGKQSFFTSWQPHALAKELLSQVSLWVKNIELWLTECHCNGQLCLVLCFF